LIDITAPQSEQSAELLRPFREALLTDTHHGCPIVSHHRHTQLDRSALRPFVPHLTGAACEHRGNVTLHDGAAVAPGTGQLHLVRRACAVQARRIEIVEDRLGRGLWVDRLDRLGDTEGENPSPMQRLAHRGVIGPQSARDRMDGQLARRLDPCDGGLDLVHQGHHIPGIARIPSREMRRKDKAGGGLRDDPGLAPKLGRTVAFALENRSNSTIVGVDDFALVQWLALSEPLRLSAESVMRLERCLQVALHTRALTRRAMGRLPETGLRGLCQDGQGAATLPELLFCLAHQRHADFALPAALSTKAAHDLREVVVEGVRLGLQRGRGRGALRRDGLDEVEDFFLEWQTQLKFVQRCVRL